MRTQSRTMPFTEEQMQQIYNTNLIDFAVRHGFEIEKGDRNTCLLYTSPSPRD